ncbi:MFS transporter [Silvibacterium sp.]|uniref:MFS transporter n=1 Tax=Silvibacterium sp. TaxID=1964179 RepID=UPI0039E551D1
MLFEKKSTLLFSAIFPSKQPASIAVLLLFLIGFADGSILPFFALWAHLQAGIPVPYIGLLLACYAGGELLAAPFIGGIADRIGRRPVATFSTAGVGTGLLALTFCHGVIASVLLLLFIGVCESVVHPTIFTVIADSSPADQRRQRFARGRVALNAGRVAGPLCGALLAKLSLGDVFLGSAAALLCGTLISALFLPETLERSGEPEEEEEEGFANLMPAFRDSRLALLLLWFMILEVAGSWVECVLPLYARDAGTLTASGVGLLFSYASLLVVCFQLPVTRALARASGFRMILASGAALMAGFSCVGLSARVEMLVIAITCFSMAEMLIGPLIPTIVHALAPAHAKATYQAATSVASDLKDSLGPATGTAIYALGARLPWILGIPMAAAASCALAFQIKRHDRIA